MDLTGFETPSFVSGMSLTPIFDDPNKSIRSEAFTELQVYTGEGKAQGYSIRTNRYRINRWQNNGITDYELYDHRYDNKELKNLANSDDYKPILDSLSIILENRVAEAKVVPVGLGRQIKNARPWNEPSRIFSNKKLKFN